MMAKKKTEPTFRELLDAADAQIAVLRQKNDEMRFTANLIWEGFNAGCRIAIERAYYPFFGSDLATILTHHRAYASLSDVDEFWNQWPTTLTTFAHYQFEGQSALDVARRFMESINNAALAARVTEFSTFDSDSFKKLELERWAVALVRELESALVLSEWRVGWMRRDAIVLCAAMNAELERTTKLSVNAGSPVETITVAMILKIIVDAGSEIASRHKTVSDWTAKWKSLDPPRTRNRRFYWADAQTWILEHKQFDIGPFRNLAK